MNARFCWISGAAITRRSVTLAAAIILATVLPPITAQAALIAHEDFDYGAGVNLTLETANNGTGWTAAWATTGVNGFVTSGTGKSLHFNQSPELITDGSTHVWSESSKGNERDFNTVVDLESETFYFTALVRAYGGGASVAQMRAQFHDGAGASGNMRANIGIDAGTLFADSTNDGYGVGDTLASAFADDTTYLLAMKRTGGPSGAIFGALILADGNSSTLAAEPTWQVTEVGASGVDLTSIRLLTNSTDLNNGKGIRIDELRLGTDWNSVVPDLVTGPPGDFDFSGTVDGQDFLLWQRDTSVGDLADWQANYGSPSQGLVAATSAVPEPSCLLLLVLGAGLVSNVNRRISARRDPLRISANRNPA